MEVVADPGVRVVSRGVRRLTLFIMCLALVVGPLLYLWPDQTDSLFAWTINPPLMAAFMGGTYTTALVLELLASRERIWARARVFFPGMLAFTSLMLAATLLHLDKFHLNAGGTMARFTAWAWLVIYILAPPLMLALLYVQLRTPGGDPPRQAPLPPWFRAVLGTQAVLLLGVGAALFVAPTTAGAIWPWSLTALTGQTVGAWLLGFGVAMGQTWRENDWSLIRLALIGDIVLGGLELLALLRFAGTVRWDALNTWLYVAALLGFVAIGVYGLAVHFRLLGAAADMRVGADRV